MPSIGLEGGRINIVPVDFVVNALDHISHHRRASGQCFHLVDPMGYRVGDVLDILSKAAHAPKMNLFINAALMGFIPKSVKKGLMALAPVRRVYKAVMQDLGLPEDMMTFVNYPTRFDCRETQAALKGSGIECPNLKDYAWRLWDYWERHLDPDLHIDRSLRGTVAGKVVLVTGGSSGIGLAAAHKFAEAGAVTIICGRDQDKLDEACAEAKAKGYQFIAYPADIADMTDCDRFIQLLIANHGGVDFLINNAGRSIRRAIEGSYDRFHDFERTMQLNYFGCLRVTMGFLPGMVSKRKGHIVNISAAAAISNYPGFSAYGAAKAALEFASEAVKAEASAFGVKVMLIEPGPFRTGFIGRCMEVVETPIEAYANSAGRFRQMLERMDGKQVGDPTRAAKLIVDLVARGHTGMRVPLGKYAVKKVKDRAASVLREVEAVEAEAAGTDFIG
jgi:NAD(P)-dependent dehydrogenase (short-subunit alcohol dehydrogenase family)